MRTPGGWTGKFLSIGVLCAVGLSARPGFLAQQRPPQFPSDATRPGGEHDPFAERTAEKVAEGRNTDRQKKIVADTQRLLLLATELKQDVEKSDKNTLSVDVVKKADEIEKLAHNVKERMKGGA